MTLTPLAPPASNLLLDPTALCIRLASAGFTVSADDATALAGVASSEVAAVLGYDPAYQSWRQTYGSTSSPYLYMTPRPVRSVASVTPGNGTAAASTSYLVDGQRIARPAVGWDTGLGRSWPSWSSGDWPGLLLDSGASFPDWSIEFTAGWWCPMMGTNTESIPVLDPAIADYAYQVAKASQSRSEELGLGSVEIRGAKMTMASAKSASGYMVDPPRGVLRWRAPLV